MPLLIDTDNLVVFANRLDRMSRHDLPIAVRSTLNEMAFRMKKTEIAKSAAQEFEYKRTNVIQSLTRFEKAKGFDINRMFSRAGITEQPRRQMVARGLEAQETGGDVEGELVPTKKARGGNLGSKVRGPNKANPNWIDARGLRKNRFIAAAALAKRRRTLLITSTSQGAAVARVTGFNLRKRGGRGKIKLTWMYGIKNKKIPSSKRVPFVRKAHTRTMLNFDNEFIRQANRRLKK